MQATIPILWFDLFQFVLIPAYSIVMKGSDLFLYLNLKFKDDSSCLYLYNFTVSAVYSQESCDKLRGTHLRRELASINHTINNLHKTGLREQTITTPAHKFTMLLCVQFSRCWRRPWKLATAIYLYLQYSLPYCDVLRWYLLFLTVFGTVSVPFTEELNFS